MRDVSKTTAAAVKAITRLASRKSGVTKAEAIERLNLTEAAWNTAKRHAALRSEGETRGTRWYVKK